MTNSPSDLNDLIGSRICHDLISPLGAISNGLELLAMSQDMSGPEVSLISESVDNANARIRFFRIAFGSSSPGQMTGANEIASILKGVSSGGRVKIDWQASGDHPRREVKLVFLLMQCFETAMPWGGTITITQTNGQWAVRGDAERIQVEPELWQTLARASDATHLDAAKVHFALAPRVAADMGRQLVLESAEQAAMVRF